ncbi:aminotransferase class-III [Aspergillus alliaceus]|uniref:Aminotransferase class-III n=1 Tax=Petromyces alliaceus TaxID=209559 RepID=A0A5N7BS85_PETAA|nr:aminotransferase class-III [Aspergillus alliaceus]
MHRRSFFQGLQVLTKKHGIYLIGDEVQTGFGATGRFWGHEHWELPAAPDIVTFSKKAQTAGYFFSDAMLRPDKAYNTWVGDTARVTISNAVIDEILSKNLVEQTARVGDIFYEGLAACSSSISEAKARAHTLPLTLRMPAPC